MLASIVVLIAGCGILGWLVGIPIALIARQLGAGNSAPTRTFLATDPLLQGFQALTVAALAARFGPALELVIYGALSSFVTIVFVVDLRTRYVYGIVAYPGILAGIVLTPLIQ